MSDPTDFREECLNSLKHFIVQFMRSRRLKTFRAGFDAWSSEIEQNVSDPALAVVAKNLLTISYDALFVHEVCGWKLLHLVRALAHAIESDNPVSIANNSRAMLEQVAAIAMVNSIVDKLLSDLENQGSEAKITDALSRASTALHRSYYGTSPKLEKEKSKQAHHIHDSLKALGEIHPEVPEIYDYLCEYVHPNFGSNTLVSDGELGRGSLEPDPETLSGVLKRMCQYCVFVLALHDELDNSSRATMAKLADLASICGTKGVKIQNLFVKRSARPEGDGKSKETAYFFPKARSSIEAIALIYDFLAELGAEPSGPKSIGAMEGGMIFDVVPTTKGTFWFKVPMKMLPDADNPQDRE